jgi:hypothetical protein
MWRKVEVHLSRGLTWGTLGASCRRWRKAERTGGSASDVSCCFQAWAALVPSNMMKPSAFEA